MGFRHMFSSAASTAESSRKKGQLMAVTWNHPTGDTDWFYFLCIQGLEIWVPVFYTPTDKMVCITRCPFPLSVDSCPLTSVFAVSLGLLFLLSV